MSDSTLSHDRWQQVQRLFQAALTQPESVRIEFLRTECGDDSELRGAVASLLAAHERSLLGGRQMDAREVQDVVSAALEGRYEIERPLGAGGMATVFLARDVKHPRKVAIKVMRPELSLGVERFLREIEIAATLQHPYILPLFDSGAAEGLLFYVMPFVEGPTLATRMQREGALPLEETLQIASDVLGALEYAHRRGVVHRDVKPSNILISAETGHALVADFGIARAISAPRSADLTAPGVAIGTPGYMPPEQARGEMVTASTDIYATALVLHECLAGRPYSGEVTGRTNWAGVPQPIRLVLQKALHDDPKQRWEDAGSFRRALLSGQTPAPTSRIRWLAAAVVLILVAGATWWTVGRGARAGEALEAESRLIVLPFTVSGGTELAYLREGMVDLLSTKLDGAGSWRTVDPRAVLSLVNRSGVTGPIDPDEGRRFADQLDASSYVLGSIIEIGSQIQLDASVYDRNAGDERIGTASVEGNAADVLELLDRMAAELLSVQGGAGGADARLTQIAAVTSQSLPALKSYLRGVQALRVGSFPVAAAAFQEAIAQDSSFALAWYQLSIAADWLLRADMALDAANQAVLYADRLSERDRRLLEALQTIRFGDFEDAERRYRAIVATYPDDIEAWSQLGELLFHFAPRNGRPIAGSRDAWNRLNELEPNRLPGYIHLARVEASEGDLEALDRVTTRALELAPQGDRGLEMRTFRAFLLDDHRARTRIESDLHQASEDLIGEVVWSSGTFITSPEAVISVITAADGPERTAELRALLYDARAFVEAGQGRWETAQGLLRDGEQLHGAMALHDGVYLAVARAAVGDSTALGVTRDRLLAADWNAIPRSANRAVWFSASDDSRMHFRWYLISLADAMLKNAGHSLVYRDSLADASMPPGTGSTVPDQVRTIDAVRAHMAGADSVALATLSQNEYNVWHQIAAASPIFNQGLERFLYAAMLEEAGRLEEARVWYGGVFETNLYDRVFWAPAHLRLARIAETLGEREQALEHYAAVTTLWSDSDPALQDQVREAREGLQRVR